MPTAMHCGGGCALAEETMDKIIVAKIISSPINFIADIFAVYCKLLSEMVKINRNEGQEFCWPLKQPAIH